MKTYLGILLSLNSLLVALASDPSLAFEQKIELPQLSLAESTRQPPALAPVMFDLQPVIPKKSRVSADKFVITPPDDVDYKLLVKEPDPTIDYRMIVKESKTGSKK